MLAEFGLFHINRFLPLTGVTVTPQRFKVSAKGVEILRLPGKGEPVAAGAEVLMRSL
jgi:hypothetical protein